MTITGVVARQGDMSPVVQLRTLRGNATGLYTLAPSYPTA